MRERGRLVPIDRAGADEQELPDGFRCSEFQGPASSIDDRVEHHERSLLVKRGASFGGGMDDVGKRALRKIAVANVGGVQGDCRIIRQVRRFLSEYSRMSR